MKEIEFVFVQLGKILPTHLSQNLVLVNQAFPKNKINLIISDFCHKTKSIPDFVEITKYKAQDSLEEILGKKARNPSFRNGFWRYSLERLFAIEHLHLTKPNISLVHVESDILLLPEFPIDNFKFLNNVTWMCVDAQKDIASITYFPDLSKTREFTEDLYEYLIESDSPTDMLGLHSLRMKYPEKYQLLPTGNTKIGDLRAEILHSREATSVFPEGIFDAAGIGMWLTGFDPRNNYGFTKYFETSKLRESGFYVAPNSYLIEYEKILGLAYRNGNHRIQIYNLHVHSKSKKLFSNDWKVELERLTKLSTRGTARREFSLKVFFNLILSNFRDRTLLAFIFYSPPFKVIRISYDIGKNLVKKR